MGLFTKNIGTVFLNESKRVEEFIEKLKELEKDLPEGKVKDDVRARINLEKSGLDGEHAVIYTLKKSRMNMYVIHDLNIGSQIDFLIITSKRVYVVECKNWKGDIEVTENGDFFVYENKKSMKGKKRYKSPTSQNEEHLSSIKELFLAKKSNVLNRKRLEEEFVKRYRSLVVFTNNSSVIDTSKARRIDSNPVVHIDQLIRKIHELDLASKDTMSLKKMKALAEFYLSNNYPDEEKYEKEYLVYADKVKSLEEEMTDSVETLKEEKVEEIADEMETLKEVEIVEEIADEIESVKEKEIIDIDSCKKSDLDLEIELRRFRTYVSIQKNLKPYIVYTDNSMMDLIHKRPKTKEELLLVQGFGEKKLQEYGEELLKIINQ